LIFYSRPNPLDRTDGTEETSKFKGSTYIKVTLLPITAFFSHFINPFVSLNMSYNIALYSAAEILLTTIGARNSKSTKNCSALSFLILHQDLHVVSGEEFRYRFLLTNREYFEVFV